jgi:hypothetical protein
MPNTFTTNFNLTKPEIGGANDTWGTLVNNNLDDVDTALYRKADKNDQKGVTHTLSFDSNNNFVTTNVARGFASFAVGDKINISNSSSNASNKGDFKIEAITNDITLDLELLDDTEPTFVTQDIESVVSIISEHTKAIIDTLDMSDGTFTTSTAQKDAIVDGSTAITRSGNNITTAGDLSVTGDAAVTGDLAVTGDISGSTLTCTGLSGAGMLGVPRNTRFILVNPSEGQYASTYTNVTEYATHDAVAFSVTSGRSYYIHAKYKAWAETNTNSKSTFAVLLKYGTSAVTRGASSSLGTELDFGVHTFLVEAHDSSDSQIIETGRFVSGVFTAGSTATYYTQLSMKNLNTDTKCYMDFYGGYCMCLFMIQEFDTDNFTTET